MDAVITLSVPHLQKEYDSFLKTYQARKHQLTTTATNLLTSLPYHTKTAYLFIRSDLKTAVLPWTIFGLVHAIIAPTTLPNLSSHPSTSQILLRTPLVLLYLLINLLPFCIGNQRHTTAITQDTLNKPWRPLPSQRLTQPQATNLMWFCYALAILTSHTVTGGAIPALALPLGGAVYNDFGGGDRSCFLRNMLNAGGFITFGTGAMEVALGGRVALDQYSSSLVAWLAILLLVVGSGIHVLDIADVDGDKAMDRVTVPIVYGDKFARVLVEMNVYATTVGAAWFWDVGLAAYVPLLLIAFGIVYRLEYCQGEKQDKKTGYLWYAWLLCVYCLPLAASA